MTEVAVKKRQKRGQTSKTSWVKKNVIRRSQLIKAGCPGGRRREKSRAAQKGLVSACKLTSEGGAWAANHQAENRLASTRHSEQREKGCRTGPPDRDWDRVHGPGMKGGLAMSTARVLQGEVK